MENLRQEKKYVQVFYSIKNYITKQNLKTGDKLPTENKLCEMLGVSRNVLREALKTLELTGIVKSKPGVGIVVQEISLDFFFENMFFSLVSGEKKLVKEVLDVRKSLELAYASEAMKLLTDEDIAILEDMVIKENQVSFANLDREFHMGIFKRLNNKTLNSLLLASWYIDRDINGLDETSTNREMVEMHTGIIGALKERDEKKLRESLKEHFSTGLYLEKCNPKY